MSLFSMSKKEKVFDDFKNEFDRVVERFPVYGNALDGEDCCEVQSRESLESPMFTNYNWVPTNWWWQPRIMKKVAEIEILNEELR